MYPGKTYGKIVALLVMADKARRQEVKAMKRCAVLLDNLPEWEEKTLLTLLMNDARIPLVRLKLAREFDWDFLRKSRKPRAEWSTFK